MKSILLINGSLGGSTGNTGRILSRLSNILNTQGAQTREITLVSLSDPKQTLADLTRAQGFFFATGTYWDSWGSPLQRFLEAATDWEASEVWLGKPAGTLVTMHSVGGKAVLSRLQGVLSTFGCIIPPMSGMAYSLASQIALEGQPSGFDADFWQLADLEILAHNVLQAASGTRDWRAWPVDDQDPRRVWVKAPVSP